MVAAYGFYEPDQPIPEPEKVPDSQLRDLIQQYAAFGGDWNKFIELLAANPAWKHVELQVACNWADYLIKYEMGCINHRVRETSKVVKTDGKEFLSSASQVVKDTTKECEAIQRAATKSLGTLMNAGLDPQRSSLMQRVKACFEIMAILDTKISDAV